MKKASGILFCTLLLIGTFTTCKDKNSKRNEVERIVKEWMGKTILQPDDVLYMCMLNDSVAEFKNDKPFKILLYIDSTGCTTCRLRLHEWKTIIQEADSLFPERVDFMLYLQPQNIKELKILCRDNNFLYPIFLDTKNSLNKLNQLPQHVDYQCFLLNRKNEIISIGNPQLNPNIWNLYKQIISGEYTKKQIDSTTVIVQNTELQLNDLVVGKKSQCHFSLINAGDNPLVIYDVKTDCGCTVPVWDKQPIESDSETLIMVEIEPEETGYFHKTINVYCNSQDSPVKLTINGQVK